MKPRHLIWGLLLMGASLFLQANTSAESATSASDRFCQDSNTLPKRCSSHAECHAVLDEENSCWVATSHAPADQAAPMQNPPVFAQCENRECILITSHNLSPEERCKRRGQRWRGEVDASGSHQTPCVASAQDGGKPCKANADCLSNFCLVTMALCDGEIMLHPKGKSLAGCSVTAACAAEMELARGCYTLMPEGIAKQRCLP